MRKHRTVCIFTNPDPSYARSDTDEKLVEGEHLSASTRPNKLPDKIISQIIRTNFEELFARRQDVLVIIRTQMNSSPSTLCDSLFARTRLTAGLFLGGPMVQLATIPAVTWRFATNWPLSVAIRLAIRLDVKHKQATKALADLHLGSFAWILSI